MSTEISEVLDDSLSEILKSALMNNEPEIMVKNIKNFRLFIDSLSMKEALNI